MIPRKLLALLVVGAFALTMPLSAAWSVSGAFEPDTPDDVEDAFMWLDADTDPDQTVQRIYFNAMPDDDNVPVGAPNPNVALLQSRYVPVPQLSFQAYLGVWKDCNDDGYIGFGEQGLLQYHRSLLLDDSICKSGTHFHKMNWVTEFIPIGNMSGEPGPAGNFPRVLNDTEARVWGDFGRPDDPKGVMFACPRYPIPKGTVESTGSVLRYFDCQLSYRVAKAINQADAAAGGLGLAFDDVHHPERDCDNPLNQGIPGGTYGNNPCDPDDPGTLEAGTGDPAFTVWDCSRPKQAADVRDPTAPSGERGDLSTVTTPNADGSSEDRHITDEEGTYYAVPAIAPEPRNPDGSYTDAIDNFVDGVRTDCRGSTVVGNVTYIERDHAATNPTDGKRRVDFALSFNEPSGGLGGTIMPTGMPHNAGVRIAGGHYQAGVTYVPPTYMGGTVRADDLRPSGPVWFTFYAFVGDATLSTSARTTGNIGIYGAEPCGTETSGVHNDWDCNTGHWWNTDLGGADEPYPGAYPRPGWAYHLRDTDCYDGQLVAGVPVHASLAQLSNEGTCPVVPDWS